MSEKVEKNGNVQTLVFMVFLCLLCALILSTLSTVLKEPQERAEELNRSKEMLIAARIYNQEGYFQILDQNGEFVPAKYDKGGLLIPGTKKDVPSTDQIFEVYQTRIYAFLVDSEGKETSFDEQGMNKNEYILENKKKGYANLPLKLIYKVSPNGVDAFQMEKKGISPDCYIVPVNGFGLWDAIYGYLAFEGDGMTVRGISWYEHKETPGLGANITNTQWQKQFLNKRLFLEGSGDLEFVPLGITVVRGKVEEVHASDPSKVKSSVDGMAGATLTGNGVTKAYKDTLALYRSFLISLQKGS